MLHGRLFRHDFFDITSFLKMNPSEAAMLLEDDRNDLNPPSLICFIKDILCRTATSGSVNRIPSVYECRGR